MTNQEAIVTIRRVIDRIQWDYPMECVVALEMAVMALKDKERVKPGICGDRDTKGGTWWYICPACINPVDNGDEYCRHCGKGLKWDAAD